MYIARKVSFGLSEQFRFSEQPIKPLPKGVSDNRGRTVQVVGTRLVEFFALDSNSPLVNTRQISNQLSCKHSLSIIQLINDSYRSVDFVSSQIVYES